MPLPLIIAAASAALGGISKIGGAIAANKAQARAYNQNALASIAAYRDETQALSDRNVQVGQATSEDLVQQAIDAARARAAGTARGAAQGLSAVSMDEVRQSIGFQAGRRRDLTIANRDNQYRQGKLDFAAAGARANSRINSVARPSQTALAMQILGATADIGSSLFSTGVLKVPTKTPGGP